MRAGLMAAVRPPAEPMFTTWEFAEGKCVIRDGITELTRSGQGASIFTCCAAI